MTEPTARTVLTVTVTGASIAYILAIFFSLRGDQIIALALFILALADSVVAFIFFRQYTRLRENRWNIEIKEIQDKMTEALSEPQPQQPPTPPTTN